MICLSQTLQTTAPFGQEANLPRPFYQGESGPLGFLKKHAEHTRSPTTEGESVFSAVHLETINLIGQLILAYNDLHGILGSRNRKAMHLALALRSTHERRMGKAIHMACTLH